jgi:hypothetical protein
VTALSRFVTAVVLKGGDVLDSISGAPAEAQRRTLIEVTSYLAEKNRQRLENRPGWEDHSPEVQFHLDNMQARA